MNKSRHAVESHYTRSDLGAAILSALQAAGKDIDRLTPDDLAPVDEFHTRGRAATVDLARLLGLTGEERVLDVGCGIGGPSRFLAQRHGCRVTGIDLTAEFCRVADMLARRTGLDRLVAYRQGDATDLPFAAGDFDVVWAQNVAMNIADRARLYGEMHRVLRPGGRLALNEVLEGPGGAPHFPMPWAREPSISFLCSPETTRAALKAAGFREIAWVDTTEDAIAHTKRRAAAPASPLGIRIIVGADWPAIARNSLRNYAEGRILSMNAVLERVG